MSADKAAASQQSDAEWLEYESGERVIFRSLVGTLKRLLLYYKDGYD